MSIIERLILSLIAGFIASKIVSKSGQGPILDIVLGSSAPSWADLCSACSGPHRSPA